VLSGNYGISPSDIALIDDVLGCDYFHPGKQKALTGDPGEEIAT
jgi:hypothetical protein